MNRSEFDHLVIACAELDEGIGWVEQQLGVRPAIGGKHDAMGTHNALLKLGPRAFLEVIAVDPDAAPPHRPRWFSLDEPEMQSQLAAGPRLITWVVRNESLATACARVPDLGEIMPMSRGEFRWSIAVPETGSLPWGGILPTAIQWAAGDDGVLRYPCDVLEDSDCEWVSLELSHPAAVLGTSGIVGMFRELKIFGPVNLAPGPKMMAATIRTPRGDVTLSQ